MERLIQTNDSTMKFAQYGHACPFIVLLFGYIALWASLLAFPYLDFPNNLARAYIISRLTSVEPTALIDYFDFNPSFQPYILGDLILSHLLRVFPFRIAGAIWILATFVALPASLYLYLRSVRANQQAILSSLLVSLYLASNWFFLTGFFGFELSVACAITTLATWHFACENTPRQWLYWIGFFIGTLGTFLFHLAGFFFLGIMVSGFLLCELFEGKLSLWRSLLSLLPGALLAAFFLVPKLIFSTATARSNSAMLFRAPLAKLEAIGTMFVRFSLATDIVLFVAFGLLLLLAYRHYGANRRHLAVAGLLLVAYIALPVEAFSIYDVDNRALPFIFLMLLSAVVGNSSADSAVHRRQRIIIYGSAALSLFNLVYLSLGLVPENRFLERYQEALLAVPSGKRLLPIGTRGGVGRIESTAHAGALYSVMVGGVTPYIFSASTASPASYFDYRSTSYTPSIFWYVRNKDALVRWDRIATSYDYIVITHPFDPKRLKFLPLKEVFQNESASIFQVERIPVQNDVVLKSDIAKVGAD